MRTLEADIDRLDELDQLRVKSAELREAGRKALVASYRDDEKDKWETPTLPVLEIAAVLKAVLSHQPPNLISQLDDRLRKLEELPAKSVMDRDPKALPVLCAAKVMCTLAAAPNSAFSPSVMLLYYQIIREIYTADSPEWSTGGARAGETMAPSAFVTWQCVRAINDFQRALRNTATLIDAVASIITQRDHQSRSMAPAAWKDEDRRRFAQELSTTIETLRSNIAIELKSAEAIKKGATDFERLSDQLVKEVRDEIVRRGKSFADAVKKIKTMRENEPSGRRFDRTATAHAIALQAVQDAAKRAQAARKRFEGREAPRRKLEAVRNDFLEAARSTQRILAPAIAYSSRVIDRELAAASAAGLEFAWDPAELAFAAVAWGESTERWDDERLRRAVLHLSKTIGERGRFPLGRPIHSDDRGYQLHVANADVIRAFAKLLQYVPTVELDPGVIRRLIAYFLDTQALTEGTWDRERLSRGATASAVLALNTINDMLDQRINAIVFAHFSVARESKLRLPDLFYPDYGLTLAVQEFKRDESIAVVLERMRAHVCGVPVQDRDPLFSLVLHGPPGTGKTTLVEALAASSNVPLIKVTPSDIVIGGVDAVERRAREVFKALSLVTRAVILFDEFDPVLAKRVEEEKNPSVFSFLTPGMLPKLKSLYDAAARRSVAYILVTNLIGKLDQAAIRNGRFDERLGIYPPDLLSRAGRIHEAIARYRKAREDERYERLKKGDDADPLPRKPAAKRVWKVILDTAGAPMNTIGRPGWFTPPKSALKKGERDAFAYLFIKNGVLAKLEPEAEFGASGSEGNPEKRTQWGWVREWDTKAQRVGTLEKALALIAAPPAAR